MAASASYVNGYHIGQMLINGAAYNLDTDSIGVHLFTDSITTQASDANEGIVGTATQPYGTTARVSYTTGTTATPATFETLSNPTVSVSSGKIIFGEASAPTTDWTTATWTARGCAVFDDTIAGDPVLAWINFGGDYTVNNGTFTITWDTTNKVFYATFTDV